MLPERSPEDVLAGILRIRVGGEERMVPTLSIAQTREWQGQIAQGSGAFEIPVSDNDWTASKVAQFAGLSVDTLLDVVALYDRSNVLGGRDWLEENADPAQLFIAAQQMVEVAYPFAENVPMLLAGLVIARVALSKRQKRTSGPSPLGALTRDHLRPVSTPRNSTASGEQPRSGSHASGTHG